MIELTPRERAGASTGSRVEIDRAEGRLDVVWLDNGVLRLGAVPALGGRLLSVQVHATETLWRNAAYLNDDLHPVAGHTPVPVSGDLADWVNYGGDKTWLAPQGWNGPAEWAGPPDPVLDSGPYGWAVEQADGDGAGAVRLTMISADDARTGLRVERTIVLCPGTASYDLHLRAVNVSDRPVRWALWNVTQRCSDRPGAGGVDVGVGLAPTSGTRQDVLDVLSGTGFPQTESRGDVVRVPHQDVVGKVGFPTARGWVAHVACGTTCTQRFDVDPAESYPDGGARVEVWLEHPLDDPIEALGGLAPPDRIVEVEVLGPLVDLAPGEQTALAIRCGAAVETVGRVLEVTDTGHRTPTGWTHYNAERPR